MFALALDILWGTRIPFTFDFDVNFEVFLQLFHFHVKISFRHLPIFVNKIGCEMKYESLRLVKDLFTWRSGETIGFTKNSKSEEIAKILNTNLQLWLKQCLEKIVKRMEYFGVILDLTRWENWYKIFSQEPEKPKGF